MNITGEFQALTDKGQLWSEVVGLDEKFFSRPWRRADWASLDLSRYQLVVFKASQSIMAFALFDIIPGDETAHLLKILVLPEKQGCGVSVAFWGEIVNWLKHKRVQKIYLEVEETNHRALGFYEKCKFVRVRRIQGFYSDGVSALTMQLVLGH